MRIYLECTTNLGDFLNVLPVLSGIHKNYGKIVFIIRNEMSRIKGLKEFLSYQDIFENVHYASEQNIDDSFLRICSIYRESNNKDIRPLETCRYENYIKDNHGLKFDVDDDFVFKVKDLKNINIDLTNTIYAGDRWLDNLSDPRRSSWVLSNIPNLTFLNYDNSMMINAYIIKNSKKPFISTFTGISNVADLLSKEQIVLYTDEIKFWDNKPIQYSFDKHYYKNRKSKLVYINDFELNKLESYFK